MHPPASSARGRRVLERSLQGTPDPGRRGFSLLESILVLALLALTAAIALPSVLGGLDDARAIAAARHVAGLVRLTRAQAAAQSTRVGLRFERQGTTYGYAVYVDGEQDYYQEKKIEKNEIHPNR